MDDIFFLAGGFAIGFLWAVICLMDIIAKWKERYREECKWSIYWERRANDMEEDNERLRESVVEGDEWKLR